MSVPRVHLMSQINYGDVIMLSQKRPSLPTIAKRAIDDFFSGIVCSQDIKWCDLPMISLMTKKSQFKVTHALYFIYRHHVLLWSKSSTLQWRHNERDDISNHQPRDCLLNRLFRHRSKKTSKFHITGLCARNSPVHKWPVMRKMFPFDDIITS